MKQKRTSILTIQDPSSSWYTLVRNRDLGAKLTGFTS